MKLFLDENLSDKIAVALRALDIQCEHVRDHLGSGTADVDIFAYVGRQTDTFLLTRDDRIRRHPHEVAALADSGIGAFILTGRTPRTVVEMMSFICDCVPEIEAWAERTQRPFVVGISDRKVFSKLR